MKKILLATSSILALSACGGGGSSSPTTPTQPTTPVDTQAPVIAISGGNTAQHTAGTAFVTPSATVTDNVDSGLQATVTGSVGTEPGSYTLTYSATDAANNTASVNLTVQVVAPADTQAPVITISGGNTAQHTAGTAFVTPSATVTDNVDTDLQATVTGSVGTEPGSYTLTYTATDAANNTANQILTVSVVSAPDPQEPPPSNASDIGVFDGAALARWDLGLNAFDAAIEYAECSNDGGAACPSMSWTIEDDAQKGDVLRIAHATNNQLAGFFIKTTNPVNLSNYAQGALLFDIRLVSGDPRITMKLDCVYPCTSGNQTLNEDITTTWATKMVPLAELQSAGLDLSKVDTGIVIWATGHNNTVFELANIRFVETAPDLPSAIGENTSNPSQPNEQVIIEPLRFGKGTVADRINPASFRCVFDYGNWIYSAGVTLPGIDGCDTATQTPIGQPSYRQTQVTGPAAEQPFAAHRWWGSVSFLGEMQLGSPSDAAYITPDPITARIHNTGVRMMGIPTGLQFTGDGFHYPIPDPFSEVFDGLAITHATASNLDAKMYDYSDGSVTVQWTANGTPALRATFVYGSAYVYFTVLDGEVNIRTLREDGGEKGIFHESDGHLGVMTSVAGNTNYYLISGAPGTTFSDVTGNVIGVDAIGDKFTVALLPTLTAPSNTLITAFKNYALNEVKAVDITYQVDAQTQAVTTEHRYVGNDGSTVETLMGLQPLQWKHGSAVTTVEQIRSARGVIKYVVGDTYTYEVPSVGVLPTLPHLAQSMDVAELTRLVDEFIAQPQDSWVRHPDPNLIVKDAYWTGKSYSKVAELLAIADSAGLTEQKTTLLNWLQAELTSWFTAVDENGVLKEERYFIYDDEWDTLLAVEESFASHQQLNDHHFHYGYFVRAAAEVCRHDANWCSDEEYGPMIELLIRDYAAGRDDALFPYMRHFDPANGFSWASGNVNFARGNNNESTSEAANAYGAMVLFGLATENQEMVERGLYLHSLTSASFWQYWNNIDRYLNKPADYDNFINEYQEITTSIIWGDGAVFSTWFSGASAHILGIQALPSNPLTLHIGLYDDYLDDYIDVGLRESSNRLPSGLPADQWRDIWWNIMALTQPENALADYTNMASYTPEAGETKAHTYHWMHTFKEVGKLKMGTGNVTADYPAAMLFSTETQNSYVVYNYTNTPRTVTFSDGQTVTATGKGMFVKQTNR